MGEGSQRFVEGEFCEIVKGDSVKSLFRILEFCSTSARSLGLVVSGFRDCGVTIPRVVVALFHNFGSCDL